jgi:hypothetical protein
VTARRLLWELLKHVLHGRGKDEVLAAVVVSGGRLASGPVGYFTWAGDDDAFCHVEARDGVLENVYEALDAPS